MRTNISMALIIAVAIFLGGCAAPPKEVLIEKPVKVKDDLDLKLTDLTNQIISSLTETRKSRIAIIEFSDLEGNITEFGKFLSEELITRLFVTRRFEVVERRMLNKVIKEHKLTYTHFFDEESIKQIGKFLGVDAIASGSVTDLGESVKINARLIATERGSIFAVAAVEIVKDEKVARLLAKKAKSPYYKEKIAKKAPEKPSAVPEMQKAKVPEGYKKGRIVDLDTFSAKVESLKVLSNGKIMVYVSFTNKTKKAVWIIPGKPQKEKVVASDEFGNLYFLEKSTGMERSGWSYLFYAWKGRHTFLKLLPNVPTIATLLLSPTKEVTQRGNQIDLSAELVIVLEEPKQKAKYYTTTATFIGMKPD